MEIGIGLLETRAVWGGLARSGYFDTVSADRGRLFTGITLGIALIGEGIKRWLA